jgi:hypothetical protein
MYNELLELISSDCINLLTTKTPQVLYKHEIHYKPAVNAPSYKNFPSQPEIKLDKSITDKYRDILDDIGGKINNYDPKFRLNFKFIRQLEILEQIYLLIHKEEFTNALDQFLKHFTIVPLKSENDLNNFIDKDYPHINDELKKILPDVLYLLFFLASKKIKELNTIFNRPRNE